MKPARMLGRCASGAQRGGGARVHAIPDESGTHERAFCGARPGRLSAGWALDDCYDGHPIDCPRCLPYARTGTAPRCARALDGDRPRWLRELERSRPDPLEECPACRALGLCRAHEAALEAEAAYAEGVLAGDA